MERKSRDGFETQRRNTVRKVQFGFSRSGGVCVPQNYKLLFCFPVARSSKNGGSDISIGFKIRLAVHGRTPQEIEICVQNDTV